jgi:phage terminase small subunit
MEAVKGKRGGSRPGAGRPKGGSKVGGVAAPKKRVAKPVVAKAAPVAAPDDPVVTGGQPEAAMPERAYDDPLLFLLDKMNDPGLEINLRVRAAIAAVQYKHPKAGDGGKKESVVDAAKKAGAGRFAPAAAPPRPTLVSNGR